MNNEDVKALYSKIITEDEAEELISAAEKLTRDVYSFAEDIQVIMNKTISIEVQKVITDFFKLNSLNMFDTVEFHKGLDSLIQSLQELKRVDISLAFKPSAQFIQELALWFNNNLKEKIILNLNFGKEIIGGAQLNFMGKLYDYSLKKTLEENK